jgi:hypothetical protein
VSAGEVELYGTPMTMVSSGHTHTVSAGQTDAGDILTGAVQ